MPKHQTSPKRGHGVSNSRVESPTRVGRFSIVLQTTADAGGSLHTTPGLDCPRTPTSKHEAFPKTPEMCRSQSAQACSNDDDKPSRIYLLHSINSQDHMTEAFRKAVGFERSARARHRHLPELNTVDNTCSSEDSRLLEELTLLMGDVVLQNGKCERVLRNLSDQASRIRPHDRVNESREAILRTIEDKRRELRALNRDIVDIQVGLKESSRSDGSSDLEAQWRNLRRCKLASDEVYSSIEHIDHRIWNIMRGAPVYHARQRDRSILNP